VTHGLGRRIVFQFLRGISYCPAKEILNNDLDNSDTLDDEDWEASVRLSKELLRGFHSALVELIIDHRDVTNEMGDDLSRHIFLPKEEEDALGRSVRGAFISMRRR
jgi:hypothetical protein